MAFDPINRFSDPTYQKKDWSAKDNDDQVFSNCTAVQTYFGLGHSIVDGTHTGLTISGYSNDYSQVTAKSATSPGAGVWSSSAVQWNNGAFSAIGQLGMLAQFYGALYLSAHYRVSGSGLVEVIPSQTINGAVLSGAGGGAYPAGIQLNPLQVTPNISVQAVDGLTYSISTKTVIFANGIVRSPSSGAYVAANTTNGAAVGKGYLKSHYNQKQANLVRLYNNIIADHTTPAGASSFNATPPFGTGVVLSDMPPTDGYTSGATIIKTLKAHAGLFPVWTFNIIPKSGLVAGSGVGVVVRPGFDDTTVYACITGMSGGPVVTENYTLQSNYYKTTAPTTYPALVVTNPAALYYSYGINIDSTQLAALNQLLAIYGEEHNWIGGGHKVPLNRLAGATHAGGLSGTVVASGTVGTTVKIAIDTVSTTTYFFYLPAMTGQIPGCGIVDAGIGSDNVSVYLLVTRRTAPSVNDAAHNTFNFQCLKFNDS